MARHFDPISLDDLIAHEVVLEQYGFISAQILNRWFRAGLIRCFKGKDGKTVYPKADLSKAIDRDMTWQNDQSSEDSSAIETSGSDKRKAGQATTDTGTMTEADALREKLWRQSISPKRKKSSSGSLERPSPQAETPAKSISSMS